MTLDGSNQWDIVEDRGGSEGRRLLPRPSHNLSPVHRGRSTKFPMCQRDEAD